MSGRFETSSHVLSMGSAKLKCAIDLGLPQNYAYFKCENTQVLEPNSYQNLEIRIPGLLRINPVKI